MEVGNDFAEALGSVNVEKGRMPAEELGNPVERLDDAGLVVDVHD